MYKLLKAEMAYRGISGPQLAKAAGYKYQAFAAMMQGRSKPNITQAFRIKRALHTNLSLEQLFREADEGGIE